MKKWILALVAIGVVIAGLAYLANRYVFKRSGYGKNVVVGILRSDVLKEDREFLVHLPESYLREPGRRFPVIYVLDGSSQDIHTADTAALLARNGVIPEVIVVGIPNVSGGRDRDYTPPGMRQGDATNSALGGGDAFLAFLKGELIPRVERDYRTNKLRMLDGWSRGALLVVYSQIAEPALFDARFAHSPAMWRDNDGVSVILNVFFSCTLSRILAIKHTI